MDYTKTPFLFRMRKVLRYIGLYGLSRTLLKVQSQYHMQRQYQALPARNPRPGHMGHVALIGCGNFAYSTIAYYLTKRYGRVIRACMDVDPHHAASLCERYKTGYYTDDVKEILADKSIDLVYIASNHATHAEYAIQALNAGKDVHIEKPHVVRRDQLTRLCAAMEQTGRKVRLGFNRPQSRPGVMLKNALVSQEGAAMLNWFIAGHEISPDHWYFKEEEGGRVLGNLCHWIDFVYQMVPDVARGRVIITPTRAEKSDCDIAVTYTFADGTIAAITFSAKRHTFEGVRERFAAHRGNALISLDDFQDLTIDIGHRKQKVHLRHRDHGHEASIVRSYAMSRKGGGAAGDSAEYVKAVGELFLATKEALESGEKREVVLRNYSYER